MKSYKTNVFEEGPLVELLPNLFLCIEVLFRMVDRGSGLTGLCDKLMYFGD